MLILYVSVAEPTEDVTHIKVAVTHTNKKVVLSAAPVQIKGGMIMQRLTVCGSLNPTRVVLAEMPRLAPKKFKEIKDGVLEDVMSLNLASQVWALIRAAADGADLLVMAESGKVHVEVG